jgi:murein DD-endopeptidase MepM/ murein hydrolase activator NlpD
MARQLGIYGILLVVVAMARADVVRHSDPIATLKPGSAPFVNGGWGHYEPDRSQACLSEALRQRHQRVVRENIVALDLAPADHGTVVLFDWPLAAPTLSDWGYHGISNFVDQNPAFPGALLDYNCGARTYDLASGYNHRGIDFFTWPWGWKKMSEDVVQVVAGAAGTIVAKFDGNPDDSCDLSNCDWNAVYVMHDDGSVAWYGHMKTNSTTTKEIGETVVAGEYLGVVGSSGCSTGPHLHMEVYDALDNLIEPYAGPCNSLNTSSWWVNQRPYFDSAINAITTGPDAADWPDCGLETPILSMRRRRSRSTWPDPRTRVSTSTTSAGAWFVRSSTAP